MTYSLAAASVNPSAFPTTFNVNTAHPKNETSSQAINIGSLQQEGDVISVSDQGQTATTAVSTTFSALAGDNASLSVSFGNIVDEFSTQYQLFDPEGNIVADNQGTTAQQNAYTQWIAGTLTLASDGTYTSIATPSQGLGSSASITSTAQQGTSLGVKSQLTGGDASEYYNFSLSGSNLKLAFDAGSATPSTRVQILNSSGQIIADSDGDPFQQANYFAATSGTGLSASSGNYSVAVTYAPGADTTQNISYNFQLYSGTNYAVVYNNNVTAKPADFTAAGSVTATSDAQAYSRQAYNEIGETASNPVTIGWLAENVSNLNVLSQLTNADNADYYTFTQQDGDNIKFGFDTTQTANASNLRVQLYDGTGLNLIADSNGTPAQQAAYKSLTTTNGLTSAPGNYIVKISYAPGAAQTDSQYDFNLFSGTTYSAQYKTIASPQTYSNAALSGTLSSATASTGIAAYLASAESDGSGIAGMLSSSTSTII
jgi:hypothetical protein